MPEQASTAYRIKAPELRGANLALGACRDREVCIEGPAGTGKTVGALYKIHRLLDTYAGSRALVARKTNTALAGSAMVTYRDNIRRGRVDIKWFGGNKVRPAAFLYPNGSEMIVNGLDKPEKVLSAEFDWAYINEALECSLADVEFVRMRLRPRTGGPDIPYRQLIMDVNPGPPSHWLNQRMLKDITKRLRSYHKDNPRFWDTKKQDWTPEGREYIFGVLGDLTGVLKARYVDGLWRAAEGVVYEEWNPDVHVVSKETLVAWSVLNVDGTVNRWKIRKCITGVDWGFTNPGVIHVYGIDNDGRMYLLREVYRTRRTIDWWLKEAVGLQQEFAVSQWFCDPAEPSYIQQFQSAGLNAIGAFNTISPGIGFVRQRLSIAGDGKPRYFVYEYALNDRDELLESAHKPTGIVSEMDTYVWPQSQDGRPIKEKPVDANNHAEDAARYAVAGLENAVEIGALDEQTSHAILNYRGY
jgi:PBSX family phage terminase large subunit